MRAIQCFLPAEGEALECIVTEKPRPRPKPQSSLFKDGIHMMFPRLTTPAGNTGSNQGSASVGQLCDSVCKTVQQQHK